MEINLTRKEREEIVMLLNNEYEGIDAGEFDNNKMYDKYGQELKKIKDKLKVI